MSSPVQLPGVDWVFIHGTGGIGDITLHRKSGEATVDAEGRWQPGSDGDVELRGFATTISRDELAWAASRGVRALAVVAVPRGTEVDENDEVTLAGIDPYLDGDYRVSAIHPTAVHVRVLLDSGAHPVGE